MYKRLCATYCLVAWGSVSGDLKVHENWRFENDVFFPKIQYKMFFILFILFRCSPYSGTYMLPDAYVYVS